MLLVGSFFPTDYNCIMMSYAISYHLYHLKNVKNTHGGVLLLVTLHTFMGVFHIFKIVQMVPNRAKHLGTY